MGAGQSDLYKGTYGDNPNNIPDELKDKVKLPKNDSQLKHIFRDEDGHLKDTPENRKMLLDLANDDKYHMGKDMYGNEWHIRINEDGSQDYTREMHQIINEGGKNRIPRPWDEMTGLNRNPAREERKKWINSNYFV